MKRWMWCLILLFVAGGQGARSLLRATVTITAMTMPGAAALSSGGVSPSRSPRETVVVRPVDAVNVRPAGAVRANRVDAAGVTRVSVPNHDPAVASGDARVRSASYAPALPCRPPGHVSYRRLLG